MPELEEAAPAPAPASSEVSARLSRRSAKLEQRSFKPIKQALADIMHDLALEAVRAMELMKEWDEDESSTVDIDEFRIALPVLDLHISRTEADEVFAWLLSENHRRLLNTQIAARTKWIAHEEALLAGDEDPPSPPQSNGPPSLTEVEPKEIGHWELFRILMSVGGGDGSDETLAADDEATSERVAAAEAEARTALAEAETRRAAGTSTFWSRNVDGKAKNRHALRKRKAPVKGWNQVARPDWEGSLHQAEEEEEEEASPRFLQGTVLSGSGSVHEQLREALARDLVRVTDLFNAWDDNGDGLVSRLEFRRAVKLLGLQAGSASEVDALFDSFDTNKSGEWGARRRLPRLLATSVSRAHSSLARGASTPREPPLAACPPHALSRHPPPHPTPSHPTRAARTARFGRLQGAERAAPQGH
jgi:Ca2+-binding EF-hand superfamily protein